MVKITLDLIPLLDEMYYELSSERLEVCLIPSRDPEVAAYGGMIRAVTSRNPAWYRSLCNDYPCTRAKKRKGKKDYTKIKRRDILKILERMIRNKKSNSIYAEQMLDVAKDRKELYDRLATETLGDVPWDNQF